MTNLPIITLAPELPRVRSQYLQHVRQFTTACSNYATAGQCGFCLIIYLTLEESYSTSINSKQSTRQSFGTKGIVRTGYWEVEVPKQEVEAKGIIESSLKLSNNKNINKHTDAEADLQPLPP